MGRLTISDLAGVLVQKNGLSAKDATAFVTAVFDVVKDGLTADQLVKVRGLGTFKIIGVEARESVNVNTGERVTIDGHSKITFTPDNTMKELVNKPFSQFETVVLNDGVDFDDTPDVTDKEPDVTTNEEEERLVEEPVVADDSVETETTETEAHEPLEEEVLVSAVTVSVEEKNGLSASCVLDSEQSEGQSIEEEKEEVEETECIPVAPAEDSEQDEIPEVDVKAETDNEQYIAVMPEAPAEEIEEETEETGKRSSVLLWMGGVLLVIVLLAVAAYGGYRYAYAEMAKAQQTVQTTVQPKPKAIKTVVVPKPVKRDSVERHDTVALAKATPVPAVKVQEEEGVSAKYEAMDARVRTGAYRIVGTMQTVTVKDGETLQRISRRMLGEGMECYVEVYNGLNTQTVLKEGQKIRIPKLELKRKRSK